MKNESIWVFICRNFVFLPSFWRFMLSFFLFSHTHKQQQWPTEQRERESVRGRQSLYFSLAFAAINSLNTYLSFFHYFSHLLFFSRFKCRSLFYCLPLLLIFFFPVVIVAIAAIVIVKTIHSFHLFRNTFNSLQWISRTFFLVLIFCSHTYKHTYMHRSPFFSVNSTIIHFLRLRACLYVCMCWRESTT